jgi:hypothetical protein
MVGSRYGDFLVGKKWINRRSEVLYIGQDLDTSFQLELWNFVPPHDPDAIDVKGRSMYAVPWAIKDPDRAVLCIDSYVNDTLNVYLSRYLDPLDSIIWSVFEAARRASSFPCPVRFDTSPSLLRHDLHSAPRYSRDLWHSLEWRYYATALLTIIDLAERTPSSHSSVMGGLSVH